MPKVEKMDLDSSLKETITYESQMFALRTVYSRLSTCFSSGYSLALA